MKKKLNTTEGKTKFQFVMYFVVLGVILCIFNIGTYYISLHNKISKLCPTEDVVSGGFGYVPGNVIIYLGDDMSLSERLIYVKKSRLELVYKYGSRYGDADYERLLLKVPLNREKCWRDNLEKENEIDFTALNYLNEIPYTDF